MALLVLLTAAARTEVVASELFLQQLVAAYDAHTAFDSRLGGEPLPAFAHRLEKNGCSSKLRLDMGHLPFSAVATANVSVPARNRTWSTSFAGSRAYPAHSKDMLFVSTSPGSRTPSCGFEDHRAVHHTRKACCRVARPGIEPGPTASEAVMRSNTLTSQICQHPDLDSNQDQDLRRVLCCPLHHLDFFMESRRLDLHQHHPVYKTGALLRRATSANQTG